ECIAYVAAIKMFIHEKERYAVVDLVAVPGRRHQFGSLPVKRTSVDRGDHILVMNLHGRSQRLKSPYDPPGILFCLPLTVRYLIVRAPGVRTHRIGQSPVRWHRAPPRSDDRRRRWGTPLRPA